MNHAENTGATPDGPLAKSYFVKGRIVSCRLSFTSLATLWRLHEIIIAPILLLLKPIFVKHPLVTPRFLFFFPNLLLFIFFLLLPVQHRSSHAVARMISHSHGLTDVKEDEKAERDIHVLALLPFSSYLPAGVVLVCLIHDLPLCRFSSCLVC